MKTWVLLGFALVAMPGQTQPPTTETVYSCLIGGVTTYLADAQSGAVCKPIHYNTEADSRWRALGTNNSGNVISVDMNTVVEGKGEVSLWVQSLNHRKPGEKNFFNTPGKTLTRYQIQCAPMTMAELSSVNYSDTGSVIDSDVSQEPLNQPIPPNSVGEMIWRFACGSK